MTLEGLKALLQGAKDDTNVKMVMFDFLAYANVELNKDYPLIVWDLDNLTGNKNLRATVGVSGLLTIDMYCMSLVTPEDDVAGAKLPVWDSIEADMLAYLTEVNAVSTLAVKNLDTVSFEYYPAGMLSMERELGVVYKGIQLELWC